MKKVIVMIITGILVLSGLGATAFSTTVSSTHSLNLRTESASIVFPSPPTFSEKDGFVEIHVDGATTQLLDAQKPVLPICVKTFEIPFRSTDIQVMCSVHEISSLPLTQDVLPACIVPVSMDSSSSSYVMDPLVYGSAELYPASWYSFELGAGRNAEGVQVTFVKVICYPVRYSPLNNELWYAGGFEVSVTYQPAQQSARQSSAEDYDMVIIAPSKFRDALQPLVEHKNSMGLITKFASMEEILATYNGFDAPEQVKKFIQNEYDHSNITYVLLFGGLKSHLFARDKDTTSAGWKAWWVPVRYANIPENVEGYGNDEGVLCDLYYGCLYNETGGFDSWDSNHDGVYAAWNKPGAEKDTFDLYPEVYVSRVPAVTLREVRTVVDKIITYESTGAAEKSWYTNFVGVGGETFSVWEGKPDGEYLCDLAFSYVQHAISGLHLTSCYSTNKDSGGRTPTPKPILKSINEGAGFVVFEGHGNPYSWNTHWHDTGNWTGGFNLKQFPFLRNKEKLPVIVVGGCHNGLYNVSMIPAVLDYFQNESSYFCFGLPIPVCFSAGFLLKAHGGAIGSTGCTGFGMGTGTDPDTLSGALEMNFFWEIGYNNVTNLATAHSQAISKFIEEHPIARSEAYVIVEWALFGDPSLQFGGYST